MSNVSHITITGTPNSFASGTFLKVSQTLLVQVEWITVGMVGLSRSGKKEDAEEVLRWFVER